MDEKQFSFLQSVLNYLEQEHFYESKTHCILLLKKEKTNGKITLTAARTHAGKSMGELPFNNYLGALTVLLEHGEHTLFLCCLMDSRCIWNGKGPICASVCGGEAADSGAHGEEKGGRWKAVEQWLWWGNVFQMVQKRKDVGLFGGRLLALSFIGLRFQISLRFKSVIWTYQWLISVIRAPNTPLDALCMLRPYLKHLNTGFSTLLDCGLCDKYKC